MDRAAANAETALLIAAYRSGRQQGFLAGRDAASPVQTDDELEAEAMNAVAALIIAQGSAPVIAPCFADYNPRLYRGFVITHEVDGYWRVYLGTTQRGWARRLRDARGIVDDLCKGDA